MVVCLFFCSRLQIDAFESKIVHVVGRHNVETMKECVAETHQLNPEKYQRTFIAMYNGQRAGLLGLKFHGDRYVFLRVKSDNA